MGFRRAFGKSKSTCLSEGVNSFRLSLQLLAIETGQAASRYCLDGDEICSAQENWNLTKELARAELLKLPALSHNILDPLEKALQNREEPRILAFAYDPIAAFNADVCRLLCE